MIKINLIKSKVKIEGASEEAEAKVYASDDSDIDQKEIALKVVLMLVFPVLFFFYDRHELNKARQELRQVSAQANSLQQELAAKQQQVSELSGMEAEATFLSQRIEAVSELSKLRMAELRTLDFLQSITPQRVWFTSIQIRDDKIDINGSAIGDDDLTQLINRMEGSVNFKGVVLLKSEDSVGSQGTVKVFELSAGLEGGA